MLTTRVEIFPWTIFSLKIKMAKENSILSEKLEKLLWLKRACSVRLILSNVDITDFFQVLNIGPAVSSTNGETGKPKHNAASPPATTAQLLVSGCHHVEIFGRTLNSLPRLKNISVIDSHKVVLHPRLYEVRAGNGGTTHLQSVSLENVS